MKNVLVTGAGTGIGLATALRLARRGMRVYASVPSMGQKDGVDAAASDNGVELAVVRLDVTDPASIESALQTMLREGGSIDGIVHSAGLGLRGFFEDLSVLEIRRLFDVNVFGVMAVTRAALPHMRNRRTGRIVIVSSAGGRMATPTGSAYCAGKFALEGFGESLSHEIAPFGLRVSMIEPGLVMTPHFTVNRGCAAAALDPRGFYRARFVRHERFVDGILQRNHITADAVARRVERALTSARPRLRYVVGWRARLLLSLRRHLPDEQFTRFYFAQVARLVNRTPLPASAAPEPSGPEQASSAFVGLNRG